MQAKLNALEAELATSRNGMRLGYTEPDSGEFVAASSVLLRNLARTSPDERLRKACYEVRCEGTMSCGVSGPLHGLRGVQCLHYEIAADGTTVFFSCGVPPTQVVSTMERHVCKSSWL